MSVQFEHSPRPVIQTTRIGGNVEWLEEEGMGGRAMQVDPGIVLSVTFGAHGGAIGERERRRLSYRNRSHCTKCKEVSKAEIDIFEG